MACLMEKEISGSLTNLIHQKTLQLNINKQYRNDLDEILRTSHEIVHDVSVVACSLKANHLQLN